jgi:biotin carboxyl carrier protein
VFIAGHTHVFEERDARDERQSREIDHDVALSAPMPATVLSVKVMPGQDVQAGDVLIVLEAMKMELPITAPRAGRVQSVNCRERELVQPGTPLLQFDVPS